MATAAHTIEAYRERIAALRADRTANIRRLIGKLEALAEAPADDWREVEALDAARFVFDADGLHTLLSNALFEVGCDPEGWPLADEGERDWRADRRYTPMAREVA